MVCGYRGGRGARGVVAHGEHAGQRLLAETASDAQFLVDRRPIERDSHAAKLLVAIRVSKPARVGEVRPFPRELTLGVFLLSYKDAFRQS